VNPRLSVVIATRPSRPGLAASLEALGQACAGIPSEILIVHPGGGPPPASDLAGLESGRVLAGPPDALTPELWAVGLRAAVGDVTAFTTGEFVVPSSWARALLSALESGAAGAGGAIALGRPATVVDRAVYFLRYSGFQPPASEGPAPEIAGDNAAYRTAALRRHAAHMTDGFWEVDFHRRLRAEGGTLRLAADATVTFRSAGTLRERLRERFRHGRYSGAYRAATLGHGWRRGVLAAPLVPAVLMLRVARRATRAGRLGAALAGFPALVPLAVAWAMGEAVGALHTRAAGRAP
jgi:hypothetical protein